MHQSNLSSHNHLSCLNIQSIANQVDFGMQVDPVTRQALSQICKGLFPSLTRATGRCESDQWHYLISSHSHIRGNQRQLLRQVVHLLTAHLVVIEHLVDQLTLLGSQSGSLRPEVIQGSQVLKLGLTHVNIFEDAWSYWGGWVGLLTCVDCPIQTTEKLHLEMINGRGILLIVETLTLCVVRLSRLGGSFTNSRRCTLRIHPGDLFGHLPRNV